MVFSPVKTLGKAIFILDTNPQPQFKTCTKCKQSKPITDFWGNKRTQFGVEPKCKFCSREARRKYRTNRTNRNNAPDPSVTEKHCYKCQETKSVTLFSKSRAEKDGYQHCCKACAKEIRYSSRGKYKYQYSKEYFVAAVANNTARKYGVNGDLSEDDITKLFDTYPYCLACGADERTVDHVIPTSKGGPNTPANLQTLCFKCNSGKKDRTIDYRFGPQMEVK